MQQATEVVDVIWFDVGDHNAGVMTLPVVKVASWSEEDGNHWRCEKVQAVPVGLVPYHGMIACQAIAIHGNRC